MDKILRLSVPDGDITVQPGVKWEDLNLYLKNKGVPLFFPLDPGPGATIGGMCGTGCSGTNAVRYGTAKAEWFLNLVSERRSRERVSHLSSFLIPSSHSVIFYLYPIPQTLPEHLHVDGAQSTPHHPVTSRARSAYLAPLSIR